MSTTLPRRALSTLRSLPPRSSASTHQPRRSVTTRQGFSSLRTSTLRVTTRRWASTSAKSSANGASDVFYGVGMITTALLVGSVFWTASSDRDAATSAARQLIEEKAREAKATMHASSDSESDQTSTASSGRENDEAEEDPRTAAFNPETGEINWDCPCLGGMAHGPCGEEFKLAFGCFVYSEQEPKGVECIEKFKGMQDCFRAHPEVYGEEDLECDSSDSVTQSEDDVTSQDDATPQSTTIANPDERKLEPPPVVHETSQLDSSKSSPIKTPSQSKHDAAHQIVDHNVNVTPSSSPVNE